VNIKWKMEARVDRCRYFSSSSGVLALLRNTSRRKSMLSASGPDAVPLVSLQSDLWIRNSSDRRFV